MGLGTGGAAALGMGLGTAGSVAGAVLQGNAAQNAAATQAQAADYAAQLQYQEAQQALGFEEQQYANTLGLEEPGYLTGNQSLGTLAQLMGLSPVAPDTSIFSNPFGASGPPNGVNPGVGSSPVPLSSLVNPGANGFAPVQDGALGTRATAPLSFSPNAASLSTPGGIQGGPVFAPGQGPITLHFGGGVGVTDPHTPPQPISMNGNPAQTTVPATSPAATPGTIGNTGLPTGFLAQTWNTPFVPPTDVTEQNDPGFQFRLQQGQQALENSAAARGGLLSGGTAKALEQYAQDYASNEYQNVYNRSLTDYQQAYNIFNQNQANIFNRYADLAGIGQTSAQQLSNAGLATGSNVGNTLLTSGAQIGQDLNNAAAARASGYVGAANAYGSALGSLGGLGGLLPLYSLLSAGGNNPAAGLFSSDPSICWIAEELYGTDDIRTHLVRRWLTEEFSKSAVGALLVSLYRKHGQRIARLVRRYRIVRGFFRPIFDRVLSNSVGFYGSQQHAAEQAIDYESRQFQIG